MERRWDDALDRYAEFDEVLFLNGIDRWMGGVHLTPQMLWRWDGSTLRSEP